MYPKHHVDCRTETSGDPIDMQVWYTFFIHNLLSWYISV